MKYTKPRGPRVTAIQKESLITLFETEDGRWCIVRGETPGGRQRLVGSHTSCLESGKMSWFAKDDPLCWYCNDPVPEEIQALSHLMQSF